MLNALKEAGLEVYKWTPKEGLTAFTTQMPILKLWQTDNARDTRNREIIRLYYEGQTLADIGQQFNISRERARQIIAQYKRIAIRRGNYEPPKKKVSQKTHHLTKLPKSHKEEIKKDRCPQCNSLLTYIRVSSRELICRTCGKITALAISTPDL